MITPFDRIALSKTAETAMIRKWANTVPDPEKPVNIWWPEVLDFYAAQGWDLQYSWGRYSILSPQLDFFLLSL